MIFSKKEQIGAKRVIAIAEKMKDDLLKFLSEKNVEDNLKIETEAQIKVLDSLIEEVIGNMTDGGKARSKLEKVHALKSSFSREAMSLTWETSQMLAWLMRHPFRIFSHKYLFRKLGRFGIEKFSLTILDLQRSIKKEGEDIKKKAEAKK